jgi:hypothetical protein
MICSGCGKDSANVAYDPGSEGATGYKRSRWVPRWYCPECAASRRASVRAFYWAIGIALVLGLSIIVLGTVVGD